MVKLLKDKFGIEVSGGAIGSAFQEHENHYIRPKICPKILGKSSNKDWIGVENILINISITYFSPMKLHSMLTILQVING